MTKPTKWHVCPTKTQISLGIHPVWSESSLCTQWTAKDPSFLHVDSEDWSDWADAQADLSLRWAHKPFCWFCHDAAHFLKAETQYDKIVPKKYASKEYKNAEVLVNWKRFSVHELCIKSACIVSIKLYYWKLAKHHPVQIAHQNSFKACSTWTTGSVHLKWIFCTCIMDKGLLKGQKFYLKRMKV